MISVEMKFYTKILWRSKILVSPPFVVNLYLPSLGQAVIPYIHILTNPGSKYQSCCQWGVCFYFFRQYLIWYNLELSSDHAFSIPELTASSAGLSRTSRSILDTSSSWKERPGFKIAVQDGICKMKTYVPSDTPARFWQHLYPFGPRIFKKNVSQQNIGMKMIPS